jgi:superfamily II RNA helicase
MSSYLQIPDISKSPQTLPTHPYTFPLDPFQQHAITAIARDENVLVCAKTGSGKTLVGEYQIYHSLNKGKRVFYTTPIKSLSNQKFYDLKKQFKDASVGIMTGDIKFCPDAQIVIMTTEILRNLLYKKGTTTEHLGLTASISMDNLDAVIFDECHYINDKDRGTIWEETMILLPPSVNLVMLSATLDHPEYFAKWLGELKQKPIHLIETQYRIVPLTHNLLDRDYTLIPLMDASEKYNEKVYLDWLRAQKGLEDERKAYQKKVKDARRGGVEGAIEGKVHTHSFVHQMNETIKMLQKEELLPALFFVLSRKQCEAYANKVDGTLLDTSDTAAVKHIITFHLHRHMKELEKVPQYHKIYDLLCRGIAFHHSGLLPLLKEIIEVLFSKGYVKIMFCTETFAVGLNMPTKTVLFAGFKKYDDQTGGMRMLRTDEYIQMAGRAGRRGKDDKGVVIYLPDREPVEPSEMKGMMKGNRPPIVSRMDFHYDFILKTIQSATDGEPLKWLTIMEQSYWFQQRQNQIKALKAEIIKYQKKLDEMKVEEPYSTGCENRYELEYKIKQTVNAERKEVQKKLDTLKNKQLGPKWTTAWTNYNSLSIIKKEYDNLTQDLAILESHKDSIKPAVTFLYEIGYLKNDDPLTLKNEDLTLKGILATEVNEGHQILMTEIYTKEFLHQLVGKDIVSVLACFHEEKETEDSSSIQELNVSLEVKDILKRIKDLANNLQSLEDKIGYPVQNYWAISTQMIEPMRRWIDGENASIICQEHGLFEGNFIRSIMKMTNMLDELLAMATYCQHTEQVNKIMEVRQKMIRDIVISDSLYLHL